MRKFSFTVSRKWNEPDSEVIEAISIHIFKSTFFKSRVNALYNWRLESRGRRAEARSVDAIRLVHTYLHTRSQPIIHTPSQPYSHTHPSHIFITPPHAHTIFTHRLTPTHATHKPTSSLHTVRYLSQSPLAPFPTPPRKEKTKPPKLQT